MSLPPGKYISVSQVVTGDLLIVTGTAFASTSYNYKAMRQADNWAADQTNQITGDAPPPVQQAFYNALSDAAESGIMKPITVQLPIGVYLIRSITTYGSSNLIVWTLHISQCMPTTETTTLDFYLSGDSEYSFYRVASNVNLEQCYTGH